MSLPKCGLPRGRIWAQSTENVPSGITRLTPQQLAHMVRLRGPRRKQAVSVRLDPQVLDWLRSKGEGHLTRINDILTNLMEAERRAGAGKR